MDMKVHSITGADLKGPSVRTTPGVIEIREVDEAYKYLEQVPVTSGDDGRSLKILRRKIDGHIMPIAVCCYTMQFIDKALINYAAVMGLNKDLKLQGNDFTNAATAFYIAYLIAEIPIGLVIQRLPPARSLGGAVICWGIATACTAAAKNYHTLLAARVFLGFFEAAIAPCLMLISSQWYTKSEQAPRFSVWYCGLGVGQIIGGVISYAFQQISHPTFAGWRIMFIVLGLVTVVIGINTFIFLPDTPMTARFLNEHERVALLKHVSINQTGIRNKHFQIGQVLEVLRDVQIWPLVILTILTSISSGVITTYSTTVIRNFGYSPSTAALLTMPSGLVSIVSTLIVGLGIRRTSHRWAWMICCCIPGIVGGSLMSFAPATNHAALLVGIYMVNAIVATLAIIYQWTAANCAGHSKRAVSCRCPNKRRIRTNAM